MRHTPCLFIGLRPRSTGWGAPMSEIYMESERRVRNVKGNTTFCGGGIASVIEAVELSSLSKVLGKMHTDGDLS
jgi:hypothetical protein